MQGHPRNASPAQKSQMPNVHRKAVDLIKFISIHGRAVQNCGLQIPVEQFVHAAARCWRL
jgi:hypothetical protein